MNKFQVFKVLVNTDCNRSCRYCFERDIKTHSIMSNEVLDNTIKFIECNSSQDTRVSIMGGELFMYPNLLENAIKRLTSILKTKVSVFTNGTVFNEAIEAIIHNYKDVITVMITDHNLELPVSRNLQKLCKCLRDNDVVFDVKILIDTEKAKHFKKVISYIKSVSNYSIVPTMQFAYLDKRYPMTEDHLNNILKVLRHQKLNLLNNDVFKLFIFDEGVDNSFCGAGVDEITITPEGFVIPCENIMNKPHLYPQKTVNDVNLIDDCFYTDIRESYGLIRNQDGQYCKDCEYFRFCSSCACNATLDDEQLTVKNNDICTHSKMLTDFRFKFTIMLHNKIFREKLAYNRKLVTKVFKGLEMVDGE